MLKYILLFLTLSLHIPAYSLVLTSPPRETPEAGAKAYGPLADYLTNLLGEKVVYKHPENWLRYQRSIKRDEFDIVFDGPHLASWRVKHHGHTPLMMLTGSLVFFYIAKKDNNQINGPKDFAAQKICVMPPPNLTSLVMLSHLDGPATEPVIKSIKGGFKNVAKGLLDDKCVGAVVPAGFYKKKMSDEERNQLKVVYKSTPLSNQVLTASNRISADNIQKIIASLSSGEGLEIINKFANRFGGKKFIPAEKEKYIEANDLLEGKIIGWRGTSKSSISKLIKDIQANKKKK